MTAIWIILGILVLAALLSLGAGYYFYRMAVSRKGVHTKEEQPDERWKQHNREIEKGANWFWKQNPEFVHIKNREGLTLYGYILTRPDAVRTSICFHGYRSAPDRDFGASVRTMYESGCNVLLVDQRAHGRSEGKALTYGVKERFDVVDWLAYWTARPEGKLPIYLHGVSMGCATVLMALGQPLPENVRGVVADCGFTSPYEIFRYILSHNFHLPEFPILPASDLFLRRLGGFSMKEYSTLDALKDNRVPVLFIHGEKDDFVPTRMGVENYEACTAEKELFLVPDARHAESWFVDTDGYKGRVQAFWEKYDA